MAGSLNSVQSWFQLVQFREAPSHVLETYARVLDSGLLSEAAIKNAIVNDPFTQNYVNPVVRLYQAAFDRVPDQPGQNFWVDNLAAGSLATQDLANAFANSQEFKALYGVGGASDPVNASFLSALYQHVLQRAPDEAGYQFWLNSGVSVGQALNYFANSTEFIGSTDAAIDLYQHSQLNQTLPMESVSLWHFLPQQPTPHPEPIIDAGSGPDPVTFYVENNSGSLVFGGSATGDVSFSVASDGTATFTRGGVTGTNTYPVSSIAAAPVTIKLSGDALNLSVANANAMVGIFNYDANGHTYSLLDSLASLLTVTPLTVSYQLSDSAGGLGALTVATANVVEASANAADYSYTVADSIFNASGLNFMTAYARNVGVSLTGSAGNQTVTGSSYADSIEGGADSDTLIGGSGNDSLDGGGAANQLTGELGADTFVISNNGVFDNISDLALNDEADVIINGANSLVVAFAQGNWVATSSTINNNAAGAGAFAIYADNAESVDLSGVSNSSVGGYQVLNIGTGAVIGSSFDDYLNYSGVGAAAFTGGAGSDVFDAYSSDANSEMTITDLGLGGDGIYYRSGALGDITATVVADWIGNASTNKGSGIVSLTSGSAGVDINVSAANSDNGWSITGSTGAEILVGDNHNDTIRGEAGNDTITGGGGADSLTGGSGNDVFVYTEVSDWSSSEQITDFANSALNATSISNGALSSINGDIFLFDLSNLAAITGYVALGTTVTSGVSTLAAGDWAIGAADQAHAQFVLVGSDTLAFDPDGTGATAAITVVGHYTYTWLTGTMIAVTA